MHFNCLYTASWELSLLPQVDVCGQDVRGGKNCCGGMRDMKGQKQFFYFYFLHVLVLFLSPVSL